MRLPLLLAAAPLAGLLACGPTPADAPAAPRSLVLVTIDTLRADRVGCYGHAGARTPALDGLAARGVRCARTSAVAPLTFPAHTSLMTGLLPPAHGARDNGSHRAVPGLETLAETLRARGFRTGGFTAAFVLDSIYGLDQGFEVYGDVPQRQAEPTAEFEERPAAEVNAEALAWLDSVAREERFFLWVHYFEPHQPYPPADALPPGFRARPYDAEVAAADRALGELLDGLETRGRLAESLVVVTSDHGESLGEHGEATHSLFVYEGVLHVPLIFAHAGLPTGGVVEAPTSTVDVHPTVLELLEVDAPPPAPPATSLAGALRGAALPPRPVYFESLYARLNYGWAELQGVREGDLKLIRAPRPELYDLRGDRAEAENLHAARPDDARRLAGELEAVLDAARAAAPEGDARRELSGEERRRLANLGYTGTAAAGEVEVTLMDPKDGVGRMQRELEVRELMDAGREAEAREVIEALLVEEPGNPVLNTHMGLAWMRSGGHAEAIPFFERALAGGFENATTRSNLGVCLHFTGDHEGAREQLGRALAENPKHLLSLWWLAQDQLATGEGEAARASLERILELWGGAPDDATSRQVRALLQQLGG